MQKSYTILETAKQCNVSYRTIKRRVDANLIPALRYGPKTTRITRETVLKLKAYGLNGLPVSA
jgi:excisionase family DNA binding protein